MQQNKIQLKFKIQDTFDRNLIENNQISKINSFLDAQLGLRYQYELTIAELMNPQYDLLYSQLLQQKILFRKMNDQVLILRINKIIRKDNQKWFQQLQEFMDHIENRLIFFEFTFLSDMEMLPKYMNMIKNMNKLKYLTLMIKKDEIDYHSLYQSIRNLSQLVYLHLILPQNNCDQTIRNNFYISNILESVSSKLQYLILQLPEKDKFYFDSLNSIFYTLRSMENLTHLILILRGTSNYYSGFWNISINPNEMRYDKSASQHLNISLLATLSESLCLMNLVHLELDLSFQSQYLTQMYNKENFEYQTKSIQKLFNSIQNNKNLSSVNIILKEWQNIFRDEQIQKYLIESVTSLNYLHSLKLDLSKVDISQQMQYYLYSSLSQMIFLTEFDLIACSDPFYISNEAVYLFRNSKFIRDYLKVKRILLILYKQLYIQLTKIKQIFKRKEIATNIIFPFLIDIQFITNPQILLQNPIDRFQNQQDNIINMIQSLQI